jgi:hypothetical protein
VGEGLAPQRRGASRRHDQLAGVRAPNAYHPDNRGIDDLSNANDPNGDWRSVLTEDPDDPSRPYVQSSGEFAGSFVSKTSLEDQTRPATDPQRYVDAVLSSRAAGRRRARSARERTPALT